MPIAGRVDFSVIVPVDRNSAAGRTVSSILGQQGAVSFELILVSASPVEVPEDSRILQVHVEERNPALRRNAGSSQARGAILAFIDDDAYAAENWLEKAKAHFSDPLLIVLGGSDPAPDDSTLAELVSDTLLSTPYIGSGVLCHVGPEGVRDITSGHDLALVNLFVRKDHFEAMGGFDPAVGYVGEDTDLIARAIERGVVRYDGALKVFHRRRAFPRAYLTQRWRYRVKTGSLMAQANSPYRKNIKIRVFLGACVLFLTSVLFAPLIGAVLFAGYALLTWALAIGTTRLPIAAWPFIPLFFAAHHATYFAGICWGFARGSLVRVARKK